MCGIAGYISLNQKPLKNTSSVLSMLKVQKHRGPDDSGIRAFSLKSGNSREMNIHNPENIDREFEAVLGFNRLSILDLSQNGHQPMMSPDNKVILSLNGEIYNAFDYTEELKAWGYKFKSTSDTEVVLALYLKYGFEGMLEKLNGMFAIVIADLARKQLFIARDRFGIKPMYYISNGDYLAFSSELKSFKYLDNFSFELEKTQLDEFLLFRNNLEGTLFKNIHSLEPGHYLFYSPGQKLKNIRFFDINKYDRNHSLNGDISLYGDKLENWLGKSVKRQLMSDVKLGCQLSGGVDSSLVTWLANRNSNNGNFESVSITFDDPRFSEEKYIDHVTSKLGITSHKFLLDSSYYFDNIENATWHLESPLNHPNTVGIYKLSQRAKEYVTVLLSGEGADEVFGGYTRFYDIAFPYRMGKILREIKRNVKNPQQILRYLDPSTRAIMATAFMNPAMAKSLWPEFNYKKAVDSRKSLFNTLNGNLFDKQVKYELKSYLPDLLIRQDKMSMAHSIENRVPFLDNEVVDKAFSIPGKYLLLRKSPEGYNTEKYLMKKMAAGTFGNEFAFRDKMGFGIPIREFFLDKKFNEYLNDQILEGVKRRGIFNSNTVSGWLSNIPNLRFNELEALWVVVSFEIWSSVYLDNKLKI